MLLGMLLLATTAAAVTEVLQRSSLLDIVYEFTILFVTIACATRMRVSVFSVTLGTLPYAWSRAAENFVTRARLSRHCVQ